MAGSFRVAEWTVEPQLNSLERRGRTVRLEPKVMQVLVCLADHHGELVPKEQLFRAVWADTFVTDEVLTRCISELRKALGDDPKQPRFIGTISKSGYRLLPSVERVAHKTQVPHRWRCAALVSLGGILLTALVVFGVLGWRNHLPAFLDRSHQPHGTPVTHSIAVLPLENLSGDAAQEYFADGMTDELITDLAKIRSLRVISRTSVIQFKKTAKPLPEIARTLNVELIVTGTVARSGNQVRITAQLVDAKNDTHLWAQDFERDLQNVLKLESDIAQDIARQIRVELTKEDGTRLEVSRTVNPVAHDLYLRGRYEWNRRTGRALQESIRLYQQAIASDPQYALAHAGMADSYILLESSGKLSPTEAIPIIRTSALKAVEADPNLADAHMVLADSKELEWDWAGAEREYRRAIELNPGLARAHHWFAILLVNTSRPNEAITEARRAIDLDPLSDGGRFYVLEAYISCSARQYDRAEQIIGTFEESTQHSTQVHELLGIVNLAKKAYPGAISEFLPISSLEPEEPDGWALLTYAYAQGGKRKKALEAFAKLTQLGQRTYVPPYWMAVAWTGLGDHSKAMSFLNESYQIRSSSLATIPSDSLLDPLRSDPRFQELVHRIGFPSGSANRTASDDYIAAFRPLRRAEGI